jgi:carbon storage regulator
MSRFHVEPGFASFAKEGCPMLVLTRRVGETVVIDDIIAVTVVAVQGNKIRLGITAPDHIRVDREEVHQRRDDGFQEDCVGALSRD